MSRAHRTTAPVLGAAFVLLTLPAAAHASWQVEGSVSGAGRAAALVPPAALTATCSSTSAAEHQVVLAWTPGSPYAEQVYSGSGTATARTGAEQRTFTVTIPAAPGAVHQWSIHAVVGGWNSAASQTALTLDADGACPA